MSRIFSPQQFVALTFSMAFNFVLGKEIANELIEIHRFATVSIIVVYIVSLILLYFPLLQSIQFVFFCTFIQRRSGK